MEDRPQICRNQRTLVLTLLLNAAETLGCAYLLGNIPADAKNTFLFGLSKERLLMLAVFGLIFVCNLACLFARRVFYQRVLSKPGAVRVFGIAALCAAFLCLLPAYRFGRSAAYFTRLMPYFLWLFLSAVTLWLFCRWDRDRFAAERETFRNLAENKKGAAAILALIALFILLVELTGLGKTPEQSLWNKNGIPLQSIQLFLALVIYALYRKIRGLRFFDPKNKALHFILIWIAAAAVWSLAPFRAHFFAPGPYEPNLQYYPYSDAITYNIAGQEALRGWGFNYGNTVLKPVIAYVSFLTNALAGEDFNKAMLLQSAFYGMQPAILYLFGAALGGTGCGLLAAAFAILKEWNALNTKEVLTIHSRLVMSEFAMQIIFCAFCLALFRWLKRQGREDLHAAAAGGLLALGFMTRYNFLAFLPAALLILLIAYRGSMRKLLRPLLIFCLAAACAAAPILVRSAVQTGDAFADIRYTITHVLLPQRFGETEAVNSTAENQNSAVETPAKQSAEKGEKAINTSQITAISENNHSNKFGALLRSIFNHGIHNIIGSFLTLPLNLEFDDLSHLYTNEGNGLWADAWDYGFSAGQWCLIALWCLLFSAAGAVLLKLHGLAGFSVVYFWAVYAFSIGFSRSSGGRYLVPCNWIPMLLLAFTIALLFEKGRLTMPQTSTAEPVPLWRSAAVIAAFSCILGSMVLIENLIPAVTLPDAETSFAELKAHVEEKASLDVDWDAVAAQLAEGTMNFRQGFGLYPRFYYYRIGEHNYYGSQGWKAYSRLAFYGIGDGMREYLLPTMELTNNFPHGSYFNLLSCKTDNGYEDVLALVIKTPDGAEYTYLRSPMQTLACPIPEPVCRSIDVCE